ncbi:MAG: NAD(P)-dependent dehydrogenase (short-subunit alcohol dehydrogenase family) [Paracoccaceae bacterium]|jgi:NAD(P)-dependent dehydrogenase (short-subunit alcohol dehydrogenase family)
MAETRRFTGQTVLITGAASGFGAEAARQFAAEGADLALCDHDAAGLTAICDLLKRQGTQVVQAHVDVTEEAQIAAFVAQILDSNGRLDVAVNNAGIGQDLVPLQATETAQFDQVMRVNTRGVFLGMKHQLPPMIAAKRGSIVNISSAAGLVGAGYLAAYSASKHAVVGLTKSAADEVARHGVRVNALCPSFAATPLFDEMADQVSAPGDLSKAEAYAKIAHRVPMRRVAEAAEIVQAILWVAAPENSFLTGQAIALDGGLTAI